LNNYTPIFKIAALPRSQPAPPINDLRTSVPAPRFKVREWSGKSLIYQVLKNSMVGPGGLEPPTKRLWARYFTRKVSDYWHFRAYSLPNVRVWLPGIIGYLLVESFSDSLVFLQKTTTYLPWNSFGKCLDQFNRSLGPQSRTVVKRTLYTCGEGASRWVKSECMRALLKMMKARDQSWCPAALKSSIGSTRDGGTLELRSIALAWICLPIRGVSLNRPQISRACLPTILFPGVTRDTAAPSAQRQ
jgi:hypothetical protein